jgi:hypothetical protein
MNEIWKDIPEFEGYYQISNSGRLKRLERQVKCKNRPNGFHIKEKILSSCNDGKGYVMGYLEVDGEKIARRIHRLVLITFRGIDPQKPQVNHINGIKSDNRLENLEWCTQYENVQHARKNGLFNDAVGERNGWAKLTEKDILEIRRLKRETNIMNKDLCIKYKISNGQMSQIVTGKSWKYLL